MTDYTQKAKRDALRSLRDGILNALMYSTGNEERKNRWREAMGMSPEEQRQLIRLLNAMPDALDACDTLERERDEAVEATRQWHSYHGVVGLLKAVLDDHYPASVFTGVSGDEGALMVVSARKLVEAHERIAALEKALESTRRTLQWAMTYLGADEQEKCRAALEAKP
jgi:hypothetical protein